MDGATIELLNTLHDESTQQGMARARSQFAGSDEEFAGLLVEYLALAPSKKGDFLKRHGLSTGDAQTLQGTTMSLAISPGMGHFLYNLILMQRPLRILEIGSSYGVSTLYLASALRQIGTGTVVAVELDARKCARMRAHLHSAGVQALVDLQEGDAFDIIPRLEGHFDLVFMDAWSTLYLDFFHLTERLLRPGAVVVTDNMFTAADEVRAFKDYLNSNPVFSSTTLDFESGVEFTVMI